MLNLCNFIQVFVFTTNHHLNPIKVNSFAYLFNYDGRSGSGEQENGLPHGLSR